MPDPEQVTFEAEVKVPVAVIERVVALALDDETLLRVLATHAETIALAVYPYIKSALITDVASGRVTENT